MARKKVESPKETEKRMNDTKIKEIRRLIENGVLRKPPRHRKFKVGERVSMGAHKECYIREKYDDGMFYRIECLGVKRGREGESGCLVDEEHICEWHNLYPYKVEDTKFRQEDKYYIRHLNSGIDSLLHMVHVGVDFDVDYQRDHVWKLADKVDLIDSIFNNIDIGMIVFVQRDYTHEIYLEVIDGKQRLSALRDFYEDRFKYKGYYYSELSRTDKNKFESHGISYGYLENPSKEAIFETFIKLNTCGKPMASKHINHVKKLLSEL